MTYYQNPNDDLDYVSWNGGATFHCGYFDKDGSFIPTDAFTVYGKSDALGTVPGTRCTPQEAHEVAEGVFRDRYEMMREAAMDHPGLYENQNNIFGDDRG